MKRGERNRGQRERKVGKWVRGRGENKSIRAMVDKFGRALS